MTPPRKILVIEDDHDTRVAYRKTLEEEGYTVVTATNGKSAIETLEKDSFGLILLDMNLPIMDGNEFLKIQTSHPLLAGIPVLVVTTQKPKTLPQISKILHKPVELFELLNAIKQFFP